MSAQRGDLAKVISCNKLWQRALLFANYGKLGYISARVPLNFSSLRFSPTNTKFRLSRQGEPFVTTKENGTGLGLYVSEIFAQSLGGKLTLANTRAGAVVNLSWPLAETTVAEVLHD